MTMGYRFDINNIVTVFLCAGMFRSSGIAFFCSIQDISRLFLITPVQAAIRKNKNKVSMLKSLEGYLR